MWRAWGHATYVWQAKPPFPAAYSGPHSLSARREKSYSFTATAGLGLRPWRGGELYADLEAAQGVPLSGLTGLGGFTNGEISRTTGSNIVLYRARLFVQHTWGVALAWHHDAWALRFGRFLQPREPNQQPLDPRIFRHYGDQVELERAHVLGGYTGKVRALVFRNRAVMSRYEDALAQAAAQGSLPSIDAVRRNTQDKIGAGVSIEQALGRGIAFARNALSGPHRAYLAAGGLGFFLGDGRLAYRPEQVFEAFYRWAAARAVALSLDWQHIRNPGYNADGGPADAISVRLHTEF